jgi:AcrR family transcriptional regulator
MFFTLLSGRHHAPDRICAPGRRGSLRPAPPYPLTARHAILDSAETLFAARGFAGTSVSEIGQAAGLSRGAPSYFFDSKRGVYLAVLRRGLSRIEQAIGQAAPRGQNGKGPEEVVTLLVHDHLRLMLGEQNMLRILHRDALDGWRVADDLGPELLTVRLAVERMWADALGRSDQKLRQAIVTALAAAAAVWAFGTQGVSVILGDLEDESLVGYARLIAAMVCPLL